MSLDPQLPREIVRYFLEPLAIQSAERFSGQGLSGARVWKCMSQRHGQLCLRRWPKLHPTEPRLTFIHAAMRFARGRGLSFVPEIYGDLDKSFYTLQGHFWEMTEWMPGHADYLQRPALVKLWSAIDALADLHRAWFELSSQCCTGSPAINQRIDMLERWLGDRQLVSQLGGCVRDASEGSLSFETVKRLQVQGPSLLQALQRIATEAVTLQPVLRDIWSDHLLFADQRVVGIIDYGAMNVDERATDLARVLGSLEPFNEELRRQALRRYNESYGVDAVDWERMDLLDRSGALLTAVQWMQWLVLQRKAFDIDTAQLFARWQRALARIVVE